MIWDFCHIGVVLVGLVFGLFLVFFYPFASGLCFSTSAPGLNSLFLSLWKIFHVCEGRLSGTEKQMEEDVTQSLFKGCFKGTEKRSVSFMFLSSEPPNTWVSCVSKHFPIKREVWGQCCQVVLCCLQLNRTIHFCCWEIWCHHFFAAVRSLRVSLSRIFIWT